MFGRVMSITKYFILFICCKVLITKKEKQTTATLLLPGDQDCLRDKFLYEMSFSTRNFFFVRAKSVRV